MCGLVGMITNASNGFSSKEMDMFTDMLFLDTLRGFDSTGVCGVENNGSAVVHKEASDGLRFLVSKEYKEFRGEMISRGKFVMGHNRAATRGEVVDKNAHPFIIDDKIILMQNGTYKGDHRVLKNTEVDTEAVAHVIAEHEDEVEEALQKINASYALSWYNAETHTLHLIRNSERPLYIAEFGAQGIAWASEAAFITFAADRANVKLKGAPTMLDPGVHRTFTLDNKGSYSYDTNKIDHSFRHTGRTVDEDVWGFGMGPRHSLALPTPRVFQPGITKAVAQAVNQATNKPSNDFSSGGCKAIDKDFLSCAIRNCSEMVFDDNDELEKEIARVTGLRKDGYHYIELCDYFHANDHKDCRAFHVYGLLLDPNGEVTGPQCMVHWIVYDKEESEILNMVTQNNFYKVRLAGTNTRIATLGGKRKMTLSAFAMENELMKIATPTVN